MKITIKERASGKEFSATIEPALKKDMPGVRAKWKFSWKELYSKESAFFKLVLDDEIQGLIKLTVKFEEMVSMDNIEIAPHNYGSLGKYEFVAESLVAFGCKYSFEAGRNSYVGFLTFESKTQLIEYYMTRYNAESAMRTTMFISPHNGKKLVKKYLDEIL